MINQYNLLNSSGTGGASADDLAALETRVNTVEAEQTTQDGNIADNLAERILNDTDIGQLQTDIANKEDVGVAATLDAQVTANLQPQITAAQNQATTNAQNIVAHQTAHDAEQAVQDQRLDTLESDLGTTDSNLSALSTTVGANATQISTNTNQIIQNTQDIAALDDPAWTNPDGSSATDASTDIEHNTGTVKLGLYSDGNNEIVAPTGLFSRESDGTMKIVTLTTLSNLLGVIPRPITIVGYVITGQTLSVSDYGGVGGPSDAHQWYSEGTPIVGATGITYTVTPEDEGTKITVKVNGEESNLLKNFYPSDVSPQMWFDPSQSLAGELVNAGTGDTPVLASGSEQALSTYNSMPVFHFTGQTYSLPDQFSGAANNLTFVTTWVENIRTTNSVFRLSPATGGDRSQIHIPWSDGTVYFDVQGIDDRFSTNIGPVGQSLLVSYQNNPTDATATIYRSGDPDPTNPYNSTNAFNSASATSGGAVFGSGALDHFMLDTIVSSAELSLPAKEKLEGYVAWKYNMPEILSVSHPYKSAPA